MSWEDKEVLREYQRRARQAEKRAGQNEKLTLRRFREWFPEVPPEDISDAAKGIVRSGPYTFQYDPWHSWRRDEEPYLSSWIFSRADNPEQTVRIGKGWKGHHHTLGAALIALDAPTKEGKQ